MKRNKIITLLSIIGIMSLTSCAINNSSTLSSSSLENSSESSISSSSKVSSEISSEISSTSSEDSSLSSQAQCFTITWVNYNGDVLEVDEYVDIGTLPTYNGETPTREGDDSVRYIFNGWTPTVIRAEQDATYTATFEAVNLNDEIENVLPVIDIENNTVTYGLYPQTYVNDSNITSILEELEPSNINGWVLYNGNYYVKEIASTYNTESYTFNNGTQITNGTSYWFRCDPIVWDILRNNNGEYFLLSQVLLDNHNYFSNYNNRTIDGKIISPNNYENSDIRSWLNDEFYNKAFALNNVFIKTSALETTYDKVYLPSFQDYLEFDYGFDVKNSVSSTRECKTTDYSRATGSWSSSDSKLKNNGTYWTRTPSNEYYFCAMNVNSGGYISAYAVDGTSHSVRPCISIYFND